MSYLTVGTSQDRSVDMGPVISIPVHGHDILNKMEMCCYLYFNVCS